MAASDSTLLEQAHDWLNQGRKVAIATVVETWGSAPQPVGSQLVIDGEGNFIGSVSGGCVEGAVVTETVFSWPGLGQYLTISLLNADMNAVLGATLVVGITYLAFNLLADLLYRLLDPRVR